MLDLDHGWRLLPYICSASATLVTSCGSGSHMCVWSSPTGEDNRTCASYIYFIKLISHFFGPSLKSGHVKSSLYVVWFCKLAIFTLFDFQTGQTHLITSFMVYILYCLEIRKRMQFLEYNFSLKEDCNPLCSNVILILFLPFIKVFVYRSVSSATILDIDIIVSFNVCHNFNLWSKVMCQSLKDHLIVVAVAQCLLL